MFALIKLALALLMLEGVGMPNRDLGSSMDGRVVVHTPEETKAQQAKATEILDELFRETEAFKVAAKHLKGDPLADACEKIQSEINALNDRMNAETDILPNEKTVWAVFDAAADTVQDSCRALDAPDWKPSPATPTAPAPPENREASCFMILVEC